LAKVPFVELAERRLQGVVSSGSDIERVSVSSIAGRTHEFSCPTNNNRPCGGAGGRAHLPGNAAGVGLVGSTVDGHARAAGHGPIRGRFPVSLLSSHPATVDAVAVVFGLDPAPGSFLVAQHPGTAAAELLLN
jgi:hypothetical protein